MTSLMKISARLNLYENFHTVTTWRSGKNVIPQGKKGLLGSIRSKKNTDLKEHLVLHLSIMWPKRKKKKTHLCNPKKNILYK